MRATATRLSSANHQVTTPVSHSTLLPSERDAIAKDVDGEAGRLSTPGFIICPQDDLCSYTSASKRARTSSTRPLRKWTGRAAYHGRVQALISELDSDIGLEHAQLLLDEMDRMDEDCDKLLVSYKAEVDLLHRMLDQWGVKRVSFKVKRSEEDVTGSGFVSTTRFLVGYHPYETQLRYFGIGFVLQSLLYEAARYAFGIFVIMHMRSILRLLHIW